MPRTWSRRSTIHRVLKVTADRQRGDDIRALQTALNARAAGRGIPRVRVDGVMGPDTLKTVTRVGRALGATDGTLRAGTATIGLQRIIRYPATRTPSQLVRAKQRRAGAVSPPMAVITQDSWDYRPGHDGIDLICPPNEPLLAMCKALVVRADPGGWWNLGAPSDPAIRARGDGIIILRVLQDVGPFRQGMNLAYGHAENPIVEVGQTVYAGQRIGTAGFANAWHAHFMVNGRSDTKGVGDRDPRPLLDYAKDPR